MRTIFFILILLNFSCMMANQRYIYSDGSANRYIITSSSLKYDPITPAESSTGTYSGGDPRTVAISPEQFRSIVELFDQAVANRSAHIKDRMKTSGAISITDGSDQTNIILAPGSAEKEAFEKKLKEILAQ